MPVTVTVTVTVAVAVAVTPIVEDILKLEEYQFVDRPVNHQSKKVRISYNNNKRIKEVNSQT